VGNRVRSIHERLDAEVVQKRGGTVLVGLVGFIEHPRSSPTLMGLHKRFAMGTEVKEYACISTWVWAALSSLTTASVAPPLGEK